MSTRLPLESLISCLVPLARNDELLRHELWSHCQDILSSRIGQSREPDLGNLSNNIKRQLSLSSPASALDFTNLLSRLLEQPVLERKHATILFLHTLALLGPRQPTTIPSFLPSLAPPPPARVSSVPSVNAEANKGSQPGGKSRAEVVKEYRYKQGKSHVPEHLLLRDTLYLLQGISGKYVKFSLDDQVHSLNRLIFLEDSNNEVSGPTKALIHRLSEVGYLFTRVEAFVREREGSSGIGMIEQSLCHHIHAQLTEYYRLIAILESQMSSMSSSVAGPGEHSKGDGTNLTLKRLDVWINEWRLRMRMMSVCVEGARGSHGGALVNLIHSYTDNGDPFVRKFTDELLEQVSKPFFATLRKWLFLGELNDPFSEFFVAIDPSLAHVQYLHPSGLNNGTNQLGDVVLSGTVLDQEDMPGEHESGLRLWEAKYTFRDEMLPMFVGDVFGRKIFSTGKSLNFIRYSCQDSDWVATREKMSNTGETLKYSDIAGLERSIDAAYHVASQRLFEVFLDKFKLLDHLRALKNYLLLGHGDFVDQLMESLGPSLSRPANFLFRHNLTATLEAAIRSSNAQHDLPDVLRRLDARMLEYSRGELGWDVFTLEYKVDAPIDTVLDPESMIKYLKIFNHMWRVKRVEGALSAGWKRIVGDTKSFLRVPELDYEWHRIRIVVAEMIHFVRQLQAYCHLEVIDCSWKILMDFLERKEGDLDAMINAHRAYLDRLVKKILLLNPKVGKEENLLKQVQDVLSTILLFRDAVDNFYNYCLSESAHRDHELDAKRGVYTGVSTAERDSDTLPKLLAPLNEYRILFSEHAQTIVQQLQVHADLDCRFFGIRLSFSDFYKSKKEPR